MNARVNPARATQPSPTSRDALHLRIAELEAALAQERSQLEKLTVERDQLAAERDHLRASHERLRLELELLKRRIFAAKAERVDTGQLELEFAAKLAELNQLDQKLDAVLAASNSDGGAGESGRRKPKTGGRRDLRETNLPQERVEIADPVLEKLVAEGKAERIGFEESAKISWKRGGHVCLVIARTKYKIAGTDTDESELATAPTPPELLRRSLAAPSLLGHVATEKFADGLPLNRIQNRFARDGVTIDRGTLSRWMEDLGATFGATVIEAARAEAMRVAFCIACDATGVLVQPSKGPERNRQACRRGHFFVQIADRDHVFFEYTPRETSAAVSTMFTGFTGYVQVDAKSVFDVLFVEPEERRRRLARTGLEAPDVDECVRDEVGCWSHARRKFWEAACAKDPLGREGVTRIGRIFALEERWRERATAEIQRFRAEYSRVHVEAFFAWAAAEFEKVSDPRGLLSRALGYAIRNKGALMRFLDDGRLLLENNRSERALRSIAVGRKNWLFVGSDDHAASAGHILSMIASARLHGLDPEAYLRDVIRVLPHWPRDRYLELSAKYWSRTRARLDPNQLAAEFGLLTVPDPLPMPEEQAPPYIAGS